jgi:hypothetical protein
MTDQSITEAIERHRAALGFLADYPWRQGRTQPRNVYARSGGDDWKADPLIGHFDTPELAAEAVNSHNAALTARMAAERAARKGVTRMSGVTGVQFGDGNSQTNVF